MYSHNEIENKVIKFWEKQKIYEKVKQKASGEKDFYFCDGPPYATGSIHPGTAWNKCLKDVICRYKRAKGYDVRAQPGFDTHGLPIEVKVEKELKLNDKREIEKFGIEKFVDRCKKFATQYVGVMGEQFKRSGVWMDWERPYITYRDSYIEESWKTIKKADEKGLLYRGVYVLPLCSRCETTLANYELEYGGKTDPSIYVKFPVKGAENEYLVIWTTTPWTLVSNVAVMVHPTYQYVKVKVGEETWYVAKERLDALMAFEFGSGAVVVSEMSGKRLEGTEYEHPLQKKVGKKLKRKVVLSDEFVTLEDGSGLVHCAPGHGPQDFIIGKRFELEIFSPVNDNGKFTDDAGEYKGIHVKEANEKIIQDLEDAGMLIHAGKIRHRYPHCWRCKTPLIFKTTDQWFIGISKIREDMKEEISKIKWKPDFAETRFLDFVENAPDWCISRQRYWGIPIPIWNCEKCEERKVVSSRSELPQVKELHRPYIDEVVLKCEKCGGKMRRVEDILDVWFDSGNAVWASLEENESYRPADFITEGKDQIRGWFYSLLGSGVVLHNEAPYKSLLMHGFFVDEKGEKMSKSVGNFVPLEEMIEKHGADSFRLWSLGSTIWDDLKFNWDELKEAGRAIGIFYNIGVFLKRFYPSKMGGEAKLEIEDRWILSRLNNVIKECTGSMDKYEVHRAAKTMREFFVEDVSRFYLKLVKKRMGMERNVEGAFATLYEVMWNLTKLLHPIIPFLTEHVYQEFFRKYEKGESVAMFGWPEPEGKKTDPLLERQMEISKEIINSISNARQSADIKLRWPLEEAVIVSESTDVNNAVQRLANIIEEMSNVKGLSLKKGMNSTYSAEPNRAKIGAEYKKESAEVLKLVEKADAQLMMLDFESQGRHELDGEYSVTPEMVNIAEEMKGYSIGKFGEGKVYLKTEMSNELYAEAMLREVSRRIQIMRKEMGLVEEDEIKLKISAEGKLNKILESGKEEISEKVNAKEVKLLKKVKGKKWKVEEFEFEAQVEKA